ncbi:MMPL family transporter [Hoyosella rhizosphaerae]|uniref:Membrane protein, MmpL family n=1 Tax=Hoyosella rhizosphaerae TaxID=1755582 RepID=A0A916TZC5_9ACTN|nr:MMPL family transporter [Hoyosella rhizosphaerae]MBN4927120.1 MMPL family transporter [Hoyosella rhizosphaerae]GGC53836.1 putative membrane protein, MmpL family [Hoyosella rhizosphaerae]
MAHSTSPPFHRLAAFIARHARWMIAAWIFALVGLNLAVPQLERVIAENSAAFIPDDNEANQALMQMARDFDNPESSAIGFFVLASEDGFDAEDRAYYEQLAQGLIDLPTHVAYILDLQTSPEARELTTSSDGKAVTLMTVLNGGNGTTEATQATFAVRELADTIPRPDGLEVEFTGPVATTSDQLHAVERGMLIITGVSVLLISIALLFAYRRIATVAIALALLGVSLGTARPVVGLLGQAGILEMSMFTAALMTALVIGAATDYAVFIIGRFHEARRSGRTVDEAAADAIGGIATVIIASGLTIAAACMAMLFTKVGIFRTAGPPIAVGIVVSLAAALTLGPALLALLGRHGRADPRPTPPGKRGPERRWRRTGARVVRKPLPAFALSVLVLAPFALVALTHEPNFDEFRAQPHDSESNTGYQLAAKHFPNNELLPEYLIVRSDHDLRTTDDLAALEHMARSISEVEGVDEVRSITRPNGTTLPEASLGYQAGLISDGLGTASDRINADRPEVDRLVAGASELARGSNEARERMPELVEGTDQLIGVAREILDTVDAVEAAVQNASGGTMDLYDALAEMRVLATGIEDVATVITANSAAIRDSSELLATIFGPGLRSGSCGSDMHCATVRQALSMVDAATGGNTAQVLRDTIETGRDADAAADRMKALSVSMRQIANRVEGSLAMFDGGSVRPQLDQLSAGVRELENGVAQIAGGANQIADGTRELPGTLDELLEGLGSATNYLDQMRASASTGTASGFYLPAFAFDDPRLVTASQFFVSPDGKTARMIVLSNGQTLGHEAFERIDNIKSAARAAAAGTVLADVDISSTGFGSIYSDLEDEINSDFALVAIIAITAVTLILAAMLRSIVAPLVIMVWALVSFIATIGIGVLVWQHMLGISLHWSVIPIAFVILVGVGADYSMLVISRIRQESALSSSASGPSGGLRLGVIRALGATGSVITIAGIVFAVTMFALMAGGIYLLAQLGFVVGIGMLLDILIVRTVLVPSTLLLLGRVSWWPARA